MIEELLFSHEGNAIYLVIFLLLMGGAFFLPIPEDLVIILVGILIHRELVDPKIAFFLSYGAIILGDTLLYFIGYFFGNSIFKQRWFRNRIPPKKIKKARAHLDRNNIITIFVARHLFYLRSLTFLTCGAVKMSFLRFITADAIAAIISTPIMLIIGYLASENYESIREHLHATEVVVGIALLIAAAWYFLRKRKKPSEQDSSQQEESPEE